MRNHYTALRSSAEIRGCAMACEGHEVLLDKEAASKIGYAFTVWLSKKTGISTDRLTLAVGRDTRKSGETLLQGVVSGITAADADVLDGGVCPSPALFSAGVSDGAVMVAASTAPWYMNGIKLMTAHGGLTENDVDEILRLAETIVIPQRLVTRTDFLPRYKEQLKSMVRKRLNTQDVCPLVGLHVVVDASGGTGGFLAELLEELGADTTGSMHLDADGMFKDHLPDTLSEEAQQALAEAVRENEADIGVLLNADCDRCVFVLENGKVLKGNSLIALISAVLLEKESGATIVTDSVTSSGLAQFITEWGGVHYRFKRGYRNVIDEAMRLGREGIDCPLAIETSGHAAFKDDGFSDDGIYLALWVLAEDMKRLRQGETLETLLEGLREPVESREIRMGFFTEDIQSAAKDVIEQVLSHTLEDASWHLAPDCREGVRITFDLDGGMDNGWFLLRLSLHDPVMPLNVESDVEGGVKRMLSQLYDLLKDNTQIDLAPLTKIIGE